MKLRLFQHQIDFCSDVDSDFIGLIGGFGSGKTHAFCVKTCTLAAINAGFEGAIAEPTNYLVRTRLVPGMQACLEEMGIPYDYEKSDQIFRLHFKEGTTTIYCLSGENWERLVGYNLAFFGSDETDTSGHEIAKAMWQKAISRVRWGRKRQIFTTSTPEGFRFLHEWFVTNPQKNGKLELIMGRAPGFDGEYIREHRGTIEAEGITRTTRAIHATSYESPLMDKAYIASMKTSYTEEQWMVWALGQFGNLNSLRVYDKFDRNKNNTTKSIKDFPRFEPIHVGMDFNIGKMAAIVHVVENQLPLAVAEHVNIRDTPTMIQVLKDTYPQRPIIVYPDASGKNGNAAGIVSSIAQLRQAGFEIKVDNSNPGVGDRVASMNAMFCNAVGDRRYLVNTLLCPVYTSCLEKQAWVKNEPDKSNDLDHPLDAGGYFIYKNWPIKGKPVLRNY